MSDDGLSQKFKTGQDDLFTLLNQLPGFVYLMAPDYTIPFANRVFYDIFGSPDQRHCYEVIKNRKTPCEECPSLNTLTSKSPLNWEQSTVNGRVFDIYERFFADRQNDPYVLKIGIDITDRKKTEFEIARLDRLNLLAEMAAGIAHEVRNPITTVKGFLQMLSVKAEAAPFLEYYNLMIAELDRANSIITEFLSLSKTQTHANQVVNLNSILEILNPLILADALKSEINIVTDLNTVEDISVNEKEIRQLILNLTRNGFEAMEAGKTLTLRTFMDSGQVVLAIQDEGKGIDPSIKDKLGTPFLTTKEQGTGLGLTICYNIVKRHHATLDIETGPSGTTFLIRFTP